MFNWESHWQNELFSYHYHCEDGNSHTAFFSKFGALRDLCTSFKKNYHGILSHENILTHTGQVLTAKIVDWSHENLHHEFLGWRISIFFLQNEWGKAICMAPVPERYSQQGKFSLGYGQNFKVLPATCRCSPNSESHLREGADEVIKTKWDIHLLRAIDPGPQARLS